MPVLRLWKAYAIKELEEDFSFTLPFGSETIRYQVQHLVKRAKEFDLTDSQLRGEAERCRWRVELMKGTEERALELESQEVLQRIRQEIEWLQYKGFMFALHARKYGMAASLIYRHVGRYLQGDEREMSYQDKGGMGPGRALETWDHLLHLEYEWVDTDQ